MHTLGIIITQIGLVGGKLGTKDWEEIAFWQNDTFVGKTLYVGELMIKGGDGDEKYSKCKNRSWGIVNKKKRPFNYRSTNAIRQATNRWADTEALKKKAVKEAKKAIVEFIKNKGWKVLKKGKEIETASDPASPFRTVLNARPRLGDNPYTGLDSLHIEDDEDDEDEEKTIAGAEHAVDVRDFAYNS